MVGFYGDKTALPSAVTNPRPQFEMARSGQTVSERAVFVAAIMKARGLDQATALQRANMALKAAAAYPNYGRYYADQGPFVLDYTRVVPPEEFEGAYQVLKLEKLSQMTKGPIPWKAPVSLPSDSPAAQTSWKKPALIAVGLTLAVLALVSLTRKPKK